MIGLIIVSAVGLSLCICYLVYQLLTYLKTKNKPSKPTKTQRYEYYDEYEEGDSLIIRLKNY